MKESKDISENEKKISKAARNSLIFGVLAFIFIFIVPALTDIWTFLLLGFLFSLIALINRGDVGRYLDENEELIKTQEDVKEQALPQDNIDRVKTMSKLGGVLGGGSIALATLAIVAIIICMALAYLAYSMS